jgi:hypothetical protein
MESTSNTTGNNKAMFQYRNIFDNAIQNNKSNSKQRKRKKCSRTWKCQNDGSKWKSKPKKYSQSTNKSEAMKLNVKSVPFVIFKTMFYFEIVIRKDIQNHHPKPKQ